MTGLTSDGIEFDVIPIGCRVCHKEHHELVGRIYSHEFCEGKYSALPYTIAWDDSDLAHRLLGMLPSWPRLENVERIDK